MTTAPQPSASGSRPLNIGVFGARTIPSTYSGYETFLTTMLPELVARGHSVTMYCRAGEYDGDGPYRGVRRVPLPAIPGKSFNTLSHGVASSIRARLARHDVVLVVNVANALFCALNKYTGQRILLNTDGQEWLRGKWGSWGKRYFHVSARLARYGATGLVADCVAMADVYRDSFGADSTVIPYCVPMSTASPSSRVLDRLNVTAHHYFVVAGRLNPENNIDTVAAAYARSDLPQPLLVLGTANYDSPVKYRLERLASTDPRIRVLGHVSDRAEFLTLIGSACGYVHGHSVGGMNPSLVEAMHSRALIVTLDTSFNRETLGDAGLFFSRRADGSLGLADVLSSVCALPPSQNAAFRAHAAQRALDRYNISDVVDAYESLMSVTMRQHSRGTVTVATRWA